MIGSRIIVKMEGLQPSEHTFKRKDQAVSMASKVAVKIDGEKNIVSPQRLFQRLAIAASTVSAEPLVDLQQQLLPQHQHLHLHPVFSLQLSLMN